MQSMLSLVLQMPLSDCDLQTLLVSGQFYQFASKLTCAILLLNVSVHFSAFEQVNVLCGAFVLNSTIA